MSNRLVNFSLLPVKLFYLFYYGGVSCLVPYLPHYLQVHKGFTPVDVTAILAASRLLAICTKPLVGHIADRTGQYRATILTTLTVGTTLLMSVRFSPRAASSDTERNLIALGLDNETWSMTSSNHFACGEFYLLAFCLMGSHALGLSCCYTLMDAQALRLLDDKRAFGRQRLWMIIGIAAVLLPVSLWADQTKSSKANYDPAFVGFGVCMVAAASCSQMVNPKVESAPCSPGGGLFEMSRIMRRRSTTAFLLMALVCGMNYGMSVWFMPFYLKSDLGANQTTVACAVLAVCAAAVVAFYFSGQVIGRLGHELSLATCLLLYGLRAFLWSLMRVSCLWLAPLIESLLGVSFGLWLSTMGAYAGHIAPQGSQASTQAVLSAVFDGLGVGLGNLSSGWLYQTYGGVSTWRSFSIATTCVGSVYASLVCAQKFRDRVRTEKRMQASVTSGEPLDLLYPSLEIVALRKDTTFV